MNTNTKKHILVIDDTKSVLKQIEILLKKEGFVVDTAGTADAGFKKFQSGKYEYVTIDLLIPNEEDGLNLLKKLKNIAKTSTINTEIIMLSASAKESKEQKCRELGANYYIEKNENWQNELINTLNKRIEDENK